MSIRTIAIVILDSRRRRSTREDVWKYLPFWKRWFRRNPNWQRNCSGWKLQLAWPEAALPPCARVMVVPCLRRPASRHRCLATAGLFDIFLGTQLHGTPARRGIPRRPSNQTFVAVPKFKRNTSRRPPSALILSRSRQHSIHPKIRPRYWSRRDYYDLSQPLQRAQSQ